ncbi:MAG: RluA family pseudouridine synthase [Endozoicomonadaceae bacterium]|nr:RluA family pseudouridine synthase [Endozoicomonadaceae bacterium]
MPENEKQVQPVIQAEISETNAFQRLDNFLMSKYRKIPKSLIYKMIRKGSVRVNKKRAKSSFKLNVGDVVRIPPLAIDRKIDLKTDCLSLKEKIRESILFEDENILVINKPTGLPVHAGSGVTVGLVECLKYMYPDCPGLELAHRIDKDTSGCLLVAKNRKNLRYLHDLFRLNKIQKTYQLWVKGKWPARKMKVDLPLQRTQHPYADQLVRVMYDGKESCTYFEILHRISDQLTCLQAKPETGRTHQIRVHAQMSGYPIIGDKKYGDFDFNRKIKLKGIHRLMLHSWKLEIPMPNNTLQIFEAPIPESFHLDFLNDILH